MLPARLLRALFRLSRIQRRCGALLGGAGECIRTTLSFQACSRRDVSSELQASRACVAANYLVLETEAMPAPDKFARSVLHEEHGPIPQAPTSRTRARRSGARRR